jgi:cobalt/nickel transport system permease protein
VLTDEAQRMMRARSLRAFNKRGTGIKVYNSMLGQLLLRTMDRAQRIHRAMLCRGFTGDIRLNKELKIRTFDLVFFAGWLAFFIMVRSSNLPQAVGQLVLRITT